ncbi:lipopolysaccharide biosynthesis protein [Agarivorans sp. TSD2052]|uniref:lipopolysaccharide biosynthesis protein n=1 Tax=Agarivorans sp. TSD2052 TaxID=2937286 RepID=UPI00200D1609|nr:lipopolysaccharide biosynthesis protein [Agarivorans sp. TSD2052]UPW20051.1 lipopolysaccharide biosynthesis protein [Agarivorans sp. TSD2052]
MKNQLTSASTIEQIETQFLALKQSTDKDKWNDAIYLKQIARDMAETNIGLAYRIIQRAKLLKGNGPEIIGLHRRFRDELSKSHPELLEPLTTENIVSITPENPIPPLISESQTSEDKSKYRLNSKLALLIGFMKRPIVLLVLMPWMLFAVYQLVIASPRYESQMQLIVQQPDSMATMDASMAILSGLGVSSGNSDPLLVKAYIYSNDMLQYLESELAIKAHYSSSDIDWFSKLSDSSSQEDAFKYFQNQVQVDIDDASQIVTVYVRAFDPQFSLSLSQAIANRAEWYINSIGHQLANAQLTFIEGEHQLVEERLQQAKKRLLGFQQQYNLLDPEAEGMALSQIAYAIEGQIATTHAELRALKSTMSSQAPQVVMAQAKLDALYEQLIIERERLTEQRSGELSSTNPEGLSVSQLLARFTDYKVDLELALTAYTSSQISLEKSRIEAYRQLKYLIRVETPIKPEENKYPNVNYNLALMAVVLLLLFGVGKIIHATIKELN